MKYNSKINIKKTAIPVLIFWILTQYELSYMNSLNFWMVFPWTIRLVATIHCWIFVSIVQFRCFGCCHPCFPTMVVRKSRKIDWKIYTGVGGKFTNQGEKDMTQAMKNVVQKVRIWSILPRHVFLNVEISKKNTWCGEIN